MKTFVKKIIILSIFVVVFSLSLFCSLFFGIKDTYKNNYQKGFVYQYNALKKSDPNEKKIIVIGGSYMTYSTDSKRMSECLGMPVYTLGVHSGMGMSYVIEVAKKYANKDDIIVFEFMPFSAKAYGMELMYLTFDSEPEMFFEFFLKHPFEIFKSAGPALYTKLYGLINYYKSKDVMEYSYYDARAFDKESGNYIYKRDIRILSDDKINTGNLLDINNLSDECVDEVNDFSRFCDENNIKLLMVFPPFYTGYYSDYSDEKADVYQHEFEKKVKKKLILDLKDCKVPLEYIFDATIHMNDYGKEYYTNMLCEGIEKSL